MKMIDDYKGKRILVLGAGKSGTHAAELLQQLGATVVLNDAKPSDQLPEVVELEDRGIKTITGKQTADILDNHFDLMVKNPGIPYDNEVVARAVSEKMPIITEVELAAQMTDAEIIGVTGSNGKTTTVTMITKILNEERKKGHAYAAGNIGVSATETALKSTADDTIVMELSSFMLLGIKKLHPHVAVLTNIFSNHLDYHKTRKNYVNAKMRITMNQTPDDFFVVNFDSDEWRQLSKRSKAQIVPFARTSEIDRGAYEKNGKLYYNDEFIMNADDIKVPGQQNVENALAAIATAKILGKSNLAITNVLETFTGVRHRVQFVLEADGRKFYNDSKATDIEATQIALEGFDHPVVLLAGGLDRGYTFDKMVPQFKQHVKAAVLFGQTADLLEESLQKAGVKNITKVDNLDEAVPAAYHYSDSGDIILLSPANASWDQFKTFEQRGDEFIKDVEKLTHKQEEKQ
ncbi:MAG: UDP-N-acetylmuramoyl-L-alanine--D-glutamate ligase [Lentilactobacillus hilgardii]|jgi:UDP-N-acetylmuramoylalanine--D-glutamate ligase|uniref:UDP-N-acetylmuramoylalanine--D-glutamate ligase n=2 Tax=Lentilactobacillus hilgardii TaxID=1588 RepID=A0A6P1EAF1_LENHI|nr:UDP-N-acetylmuramoyl-L-alanine--D-glutamate ligase [Lentilactobacillus hilgardii]MCI1923430.1 UDP-N-acetylmuramoyl-L-alanine--D-glutamate ligase [Lentilactobacillus buchneri]RRG07639.1 MAG: UDP-N-acetylmuramoyl-L-alanine--D-glutamate ligase [Lactobacillus sp.]EEI71158.1 UDP-N-acetylmuramoyl-L-alanine--D-glutamate ligase [Lentilactobacillus hilgardii ATCC 27305]MBZ2200700.1 UDP-N-acetylmuramoyl-L-alanine--D-glutamate ligase [Lentilactobacillus hilgardii]MBZ2203485.1 UDP-N-acetylmuramoyl-L-al